MPRNLILGFVNTNREIWIVESDFTCDYLTKLFIDDILCTLNNNESELSWFMHLWLPRMGNTIDSCGNLI